MEPAQRKHLGAFYTPYRVARVLVDWAVRDQRSRVLDPACGEGVFLRASADRLGVLKGDTEQIFGIELDCSHYERSVIPLVSQLSIPRSNVLVSDFFDVPSSSLPQFAAVVGNPPFIRYQTFKGESRDKALAIARCLGVNLSELASSWAPFLIHATQFLAPSGRLAMVVPVEITHAAYARPIVHYLAKKFSGVYLAAFRERLFPGLNEDTLLMFAEGRGGRCKEIRLKRFETLEQLASLLEGVDNFGKRVPLRKLQNSNGRLRVHFLTSELSRLYNFLGGDSRVCRLGEIAQVGIGYVTGNNEFFHLTEEETHKYEVPRRFLKPTLLRSGIVKGLRFSQEDWMELRKQGQKVYLLCLPRIGEAELSAGVRQYLSQGKARRVHKAYKCSVREPWFTVPHSDPAHAFLSYMSGDAPKIAWNAAYVLATNSSHLVRFNSLPKAEPWKVALAFSCSLSQLSGEIEGHPLGGGMLKLEPTEAEHTLVVRPEIIRASRDQFEEIDTLVRSKQVDSAADLADELVLRDSLGLTWDQILLLRDGLGQLRAIRRKNIAATRGHKKRRSEATSIIGQTTQATLL